ncbi:MAG: T9SS type A sorting domain-containing protein [Chitinophagales bacterium]
MKIKCSIFCLFPFLIFQSLGQVPSVSWAKSFGNSTIGYDIISSLDGNIIILGGVNASDTVVNCNLKGDQDILVTKIDPAGNILWQHCYGGSNDEGFFSGNTILQTNDHGYIFSTRTLSNDGDVSGNDAYDDIWVVKIDSIGTIQWQHCYGGLGSDVPAGIIQLDNDYFIIIGLTNSPPGNDIPFRYGSSFDNDVLAIKIDKDGNLLWSDVYGGSAEDAIRSVRKISPNLLQMVGHTTSGDGNLEFVLPVYGNSDGWLIRIDSNGSVLDQKRYGGESSDELNDQLVNGDGSSVLFGSSSSSTGEFANNHGYDEYWAIKIDFNKNKIWQNLYGGSGVEEGKKILEAPYNSGYYLMGNSNSADGQISDHHGLGRGGCGLCNDFWIVKTNLSGELLWEISLGGSKLEYAYGMLSKNEDLIVTGYSESTDGDATISGVGALTIDLVDFNSISIQSNNPSFKLFPNPTKGNLNFLTTNELAKSLQLQIFNVQSQLIQQYKIERSNQSIWLNASPGIYFYRIIDSENQLFSTGNLLIQ